MDTTTEEKRRSRALDRIRNVEAFNPPVQHIEQAASDKAKARAEVVERFNRLARENGYDGEPMTCAALDDETLCEWVNRLAMSMAERAMEAWQSWPGPVPEAEFLRDVGNRLKHQTGRTAVALLSKACGEHVVIFEDGSEMHWTPPGRLGAALDPDKVRKCRETGCAYVAA